MDEASTLPKRKAVNLTIRTEIMHQADHFKSTRQKQLKLGCNLQFLKQKKLSGSEKTTMQYLNTMKEPILRGFYYNLNRCRNK